MRCGRDTHCWRLDWVRTDTHRHTDRQKWKQYIRQFHSIYLADIKIYVDLGIRFASPDNGHLEQLAITSFCNIHSSFRRRPINWKLNYLDQPTVNILSTLLCAQSVALQIQFVSCCIRIVLDPAGYGHRSNRCTTCARDGERVTTNFAVIYLRPY